MYKSSCVLGLLQCDLHRSGFSPTAMIARNQSTRNIIEKLPCFHFFMATHPLHRASSGRSQTQ